MALRLRRVFSLSCPLLKRSLHQPKPISLISSRFLSTLISTTSPAAAVIPSSNQLSRSFTSTSALFAKTFDPETDEIGPDTILFEGCDYNHWLITVDFKDPSREQDPVNISREQKIETYVNLAAKIFGSVEEAKKRIYALSTTTYDGFQVECTEEVSERFKEFPEVVFILPDSYIDPINKEYGGDKYINGEIIPRAPPVHYGRQNRDRRKRDDFGSPPQQNYGPPRQQNYGPPRQQNYGPPQQQNYGPPQQQNYGPPQQQNNGPPLQQGYVPPPQQGHVPPPQQGFVPPPQQNNGPPLQQGYVPPRQQRFELPQQQNNGLPRQQGYGPPHEQSYEPAKEQSNGPPHHQSNLLPQQQGYASQQSYGAQGSGDRRNFTPPSNDYQGGSNQTFPRNQYSEGQRDFQQGNFQRHGPSQQSGFSPDAEYGSSRGGNFEQAPGPPRNF